MCYTVANRLCRKVNETSKVMLAVGNWARRNLSKTKYKGVRGVLRPVLQYIIARRMAVVGTASEYNSSQRGLDGQKLRWIAAPARKKPCTHDSDLPCRKGMGGCFRFCTSAHCSRRRRKGYLCNQCYAWSPTKKQGVCYSVKRVEKPGGQGTVVQPRMFGRDTVASINIGCITLATVLVDADGTRLIDRSMFVYGNVDGPNGNVAAMGWDEIFRGYGGAPFRIPPMKSFYG